jgi:protein SCO1/2
MRAGLVISAVMLASVTLTFVMRASPSNDPADRVSDQQPLPKIAPAPLFALISQDGTQVRLSDLRGKVVAVTFIFTFCSVTCPVMTPIMSSVQRQLGPDFGDKVVFASITIDPERDTPEMLKLYAQAHGADVAGWSFLTGPVPVIQDLTRRYGVFASKKVDGDIEHSFLTSVIDRHGMLRVQYLGVRFDPNEFRFDLVNLMKER